MRGPDEVRASFWSLLAVFGHPIHDALFAPMHLLPLMDPLELENQRLRRHVMLAKYAHQSFRDLQEMPTRDVKRYVRVLAEFLDEEHAATQKAIEAASNRRDAERRGDE